MQDEMDVAMGISIHAPRKGERRVAPALQRLPCSFQSTLPARGSDTKYKDHPAVAVHFNPRSPQGGATKYYTDYDVSMMISIHAPRKGERRYNFVKQFGLRLISIHAPRKGERRVLVISFGRLMPFQSTLPARGSDRRAVCNGGTLTSFQSTLPARGSDDPRAVIHSTQGRDFNPRSPQGGATGRIVAVVRAKQISIHAPRKGERRWM